MDPGYIVVVIFGVLVVAAVLGVALITIVLSGIRGEHAQWPVRPERGKSPDETGLAAIGREPGGEHPEWTGRDLAGDDLRPVGTHEEKRAAPGRARWW
ncbi:hypothetical protein Skr01_45660 [Sphaerisporangium krabiense]|uniref:Uncharacterized protein n=1 Tax=Sphaerisporangium krabiense TaxID=763782 RepID=A0A7W9DQF8_9ACTN|nr:hypothetical protein [Sphaerisporangium krabiense]MBB5627383.1 hypothetical protein [Sphaerisporangium krabiense]GII64481.1 hypothetical protein Skr01_45660 [Sphaerisporangium krabiense]